MLSTSANWKQTMGRSGIEPVYVVELHLSSTDTRYFSTAYVELSDLAEIPVLPNVSDVVGVSSSIDVETRSVSIGELHVTFNDDGVLRDIVKANFIYGKKVVVKLGCTNFRNYSDFINVGIGVTRDLTPEEGEISLECTDITILLRNKTIGPRYWLNGHPLEVMQDILNAAGIASSLYDATTLNWEADLTRSHFLCSRYDLRRYNFDDSFVSNGVNDSGEDAAGLLQELAELMHGSFAPDESGIFKFAFYDGTKAVDRDLQEGDIGGVDQMTTHEHLYNKVTFTAAEQARQLGPAGQDDPLSKWGKHTEKSVTIGFTQIDKTSQANHNYLGNESGENDFEISTPWSVGCSGISRGLKLVGSDLSFQENTTRNQVTGVQLRTQVMADADAILLIDAAYNGFSGSKFDLGTIAYNSRTGDQQTYPHTFPVQTNRNISSSRPAYLLFEGPALRVEFIAKVKTAPSIGATSIVLDSINANFTVNQLVMFGQDYGPVSGGVHTGYRVTAWDSSTGILQITPGITTAAPVGAPVNEIIGPTVPPRDRKQWQTEIVKCTSSFSWAYMETGLENSGTPVHLHRSLNEWPGRNGSLGPFAGGQRMVKSGDIAITAIGNNPTRAVDGEEAVWPYQTLYNLRYPSNIIYRFEGTAGAFGTHPSGNPGLGSSASGRGQFGTEAPEGWIFGQWDPELNFFANEDPQSLYTCQIWDITILVDSVNRMLERFANGVPKVRIKTPLLHADLQLGDFVTIQTNLYSAYNKDGADENVVFEVISKTIDALADDPGCSFELAWVRNVGSSYSPTYEYNPFVAQKAYREKLADSVYEINDSTGESSSVITDLGIKVSQ